MLNFLHNSLQIQHFCSMFCCSGPILTEFPFRIATNEYQGAINLINEEIEVIEICSFDGLIFIVEVQILDDLEIEAELIVWDDEKSQDDCKERHVPSKVINDTEYSFIWPLDIKYLIASLDIKGKVIVHFFPVSRTRVSGTDVGFGVVNEGVNRHGIELDETFSFFGFVVVVEEQVIVGGHFIRGQIQLGLRSECGVVCELD